MSREIKFRARAKHDGSWVYGFYLERDGYDKGMIYERNGMGHDVDLKTRGEYTGRRDKNGVKIYEGDILELRRAGGSPGVLIRYEAYWDAALAMFVDNKVGGDPLYLIAEHTEIIGNIYENPELIEGKEGHE